MGRELTDAVVPPVVLHGRACSTSKKSRAWGAQPAATDQNERTFGYACLG
jgi:hypothetical protein